MSLIPWLKHTLKIHQETINLNFGMQWQIAFTGVVYPCLILAYMGDAAFLSKHKGDLQRSFYMSIPGEHICVEIKSIICLEDIGKLGSCILYNKEEHIFFFAEVEKLVDLWQQFGLSGVLNTSNFLF